MLEVCSLISCESKVLELALTQRTVEAVKDNVKTDLNSVEVCNCFFLSLLSCYQLSRGLKLIFIMIHFKAVAF